MSSGFAPVDKMPRVGDPVWEAMRQTDRALHQRAATKIHHGISLYVLMVVDFGEPGHQQGVRCNGILQAEPASPGSPSIAKKEIMG